MTVSAKKIRVAINGFGRIGRQFLRCWEGRGANSNLEVVAVNDSGGVKQASHLLKYDSTMGTFKADVKVGGCWGLGWGLRGTALLFYCHLAAVAAAPSCFAMACACPPSSATPSFLTPSARPPSRRPSPAPQVTGEDTFSINGKEIKVVSSRDPTKLPWAAMNVDLVIEGTGVFIDRPGASKHIEAGAKKVGRSGSWAAGWLTPGWLPTSWHCKTLNSPARPRLVHVLLPVNSPCSLPPFPHPSPHPTPPAGADHRPRQGLGHPHLRGGCQRGGLQAL